MRVIDTLDDIKTVDFAHGSAVAIGKFDGVHRGHQALLNSVLTEAAERGVRPVVFTFSNNPLSLLRPEACPPALMSRQQRLDALAAAGIETCVMVPFDTEFAQITAEDFVERVLVGGLQVAQLSLGADFTFGRGGHGNVALLTEMGRQRGFRVEVIADVEDEQLGRVSSSRIREAILSGDVATAHRMLGRPIALRAEVVTGDARGREIGFATANLGGRIEGLRPVDGVYAGWALVHGERHKAAISVGANVTFEPEGEPRVEAHLLDFEGDIYGETIEVQFVARLRGMVAFASVEQLVARMHEDVRETRQLLAEQ